VRIFETADYLQAFEGTVPGPDNLDDWRVSGHGSSGSEGRTSITSLTLSKTFGLPGDRAEIRLSTSPLRPVSVYVYRLLTESLHHVLPQSRIHFPLEVRVEKERASIRVNGRSRACDLLVCGHTVHAGVRVGPVHVGVLGDRAFVESLSLRSLTERELARLLRPYREQQTARMKARGR
jgi:hypothetical protein